MNAIKNNKALSLLVIFLTYGIATVVGVVLYRTMVADWRYALLCADIAATAVVFLVSILFDNASVYDPYWSVAPMVMVIGLLGESNKKTSALAVLMIIAVLIWGARLTANWAYTFKNLTKQDWRYDMLEEKTGAAYPLVNLFGIHLFPTLMVYVAMLPVAHVIKQNIKGGALSIIAVSLAFVAVAIEFISDWQMHTFRRDKKTVGFIRRGLWKYTRHPNYLGEILVWVFLGAALVTAAPSLWYYLAGAVLMLLMFLFISIPMADKRNSQRAGYGEYKAETRALLPIPKPGVTYTKEQRIEEPKKPKSSKHKRKKKSKKK